jgi:hypothetical protein
MFSGGQQGKPETAGTGQGKPSISADVSDDSSALSASRSPMQVECAGELLCSHMGPCGMRPPRAGPSRFRVRATRVSATTECSCECRALGWALITGEAPPREVLREQACQPAEGAGERHKSTPPPRNAAPQRRPQPDPGKSEEPDTLTVDDHVFVKDERRERLGGMSVAPPDATRD